jgi:hypothetical protein
MVNASNRPFFAPSRVTSLPRAAMRRSAARGGCSMPSFSKLSAMTAMISSLPPSRLGPE